MFDSAKFLNQVMRLLDQETQSLSQAPKPHLSVIRETDDEVVVFFEVPGIQSREDINFFVAITRLTIKGVRHKIGGFNPSGPEMDTPREEFEKTFALPCPVRPETARALYGKGIMELRIKKMPDKIWNNVFVQFLS